MTPHIHILQQTLSTDERKQAERFYFQEHRKRYIVTRGLLRLILGRYLDIEPSQLEFCYNPYGKPALAKAFGGERLQFNLSHSDKIILYAIAYCRKVGIDIEHIGVDLADEQIAERFFSPREVAELRGLPVIMQKEAFFSCWTRKEAYIKARGEGLSLSLDQFDVSVVPEEPTALLSVNGDPQEALRWSLKELNPGPGYVATLAVEGHDWQVKYWRMPSQKTKYT